MTRALSSHLRMAWEGLQFVDNIWNKLCVKIKCANPKIDFRPLLIDEIILHDRQPHDSVYYIT